MAQAQADEAIDRIWTVSNVISFIRLLMIPLFLVLLFQDNNIAAAIVFGVAAGTDFLDGMIARKTHTVSKLGQLLDPAVDRLLMISGVVGVFLTGRLPLWIIVLVFARDALLLGGGAWLLRRWHIRVPVIYAGKVATTFLFIGFAGLVLNMPLIPGLGWFEVSWLPGFSSASVCWAIWFIYGGLLLNIYTTTFYVVSAWRQLAQAKTKARSS